MSTHIDRLTAPREPSTPPEPQRLLDGAPVASRRERPPVWSRVMQEARARALLLAHRAFPWRYY